MRIIVIGAVALQLDVDQLEAVTADHTGLGRSGETLLAHRIGDDAIFTAPLRHVQQAAFNHRIPLRKTDLPMRRPHVGQ